MTWVIDTCIIIGILANEPSFGLRSAKLLEDHLEEGLSICSVTYVELAPAFEGDLDEQQNFLGQAGIDYRSDWTAAD
jgi:predicted nucleic acid-binding protein